MGVWLLRGPACLGPLMVVAALAPAPALGADSAEERFARYLTLIDAYREGAREAAVLKLGTLGPVWAERGADELLERCREAEKTEVVLWVRRAQVAFLLHVDTAMRDLGPQRAGYEEHVDAALRLLRWFRTRREQPAEARGLRPRDFYMALASAELVAARPDEAALLAEESLRSYERDFRMQLLAGCAADLRALLLRQSNDGRRFDRDLARAEGRFRKVLDIDPENDAARLRLGWVLVRRGRPAEARPLLVAVARETGDEDRRFLGLLFLGAAHEGAMDNESAIEAYRKAAALAPDGQAAHVALAQALERVVGQAAAREVLQPFFAERARSWVRSDPWNEYPFGPPELRLQPLTNLIRKLCPR